MEPESSGGELGVVQTVVISYTRKSCFDGFIGTNKKQQGVSTVTDIGNRIPGCDWVGRAANAESNLGGKEIEM